MSTNKEIINKVNEAFIQNDTETFLHYCHENIIWTLVGTSVWKGKEEIRNALKVHDEQPPVFTINQTIAEANTVVSNGTMQMTLPGGKLFKGEFCDFYRFENGKISEMHSYVVETK